MVLAANCIPVPLRWLVWAGLKRYRLLDGPYARICWRYFYFRRPGHKRVCSWKTYRYLLKLFKQAWNSRQIGLFASYISNRDFVSHETATVACKRVRWRVYCIGLSLEHVNFLLFVLKTIELWHWNGSTTYCCLSIVGFLLCFHLILTVKSCTLCPVAALLAFIQMYIMLCPNAHRSEALYISERSKFDQMFSLIGIFRAVGC